jgi:hypothetical protein
MGITNGVLKRKEKISARFSPTDLILEEGGKMKFWFFSPCVSDCNARTGMRCASPAPARTGM